jgi:hypothetical protein
LPRSTRPYPCVADTPLLHTTPRCNTTTAISGASLGTAFGINSAVCIVALIVFSILRVRPFTRKFYAPKR